MHVLKMLKSILEKQRITGQGIAPVRGRMNQTFGAQVSSSSLKPKVKRYKFLVYPWITQKRNEAPCKHVMHPLDSVLLPQCQKLKENPNCLYVFLYVYVCIWVCFFFRLHWASWWYSWKCHERGVIICILHPMPGTCINVLSSIQRIV